MDVAAAVERAVRGVGASSARDVQVLARRADATVVVALTLVPSSRRVVVKVRAGSSGPDGTRAATALRALSAALPPDSPLGVPDVLWHDAAAGVLVIGHVPGEPLDQSLAGGDLAALNRAGAALAVLHGLPAVLGPAVGLRHALADLVAPHPLVLAAAVPELAARVTAVLTGVLAAEPLVRPAAPVHRDVHLRQLHGDGARTWLLDWDSAAQGDPAFDVGNLVASLRSKAVGEAAVAALLDGYAGADRSGALARTPVYEAFTYLRLACKRYRVHGAPALQEVVCLVAAAEHALGAGPAPSSRRERVRA